MVDEDAQPLTMVEKRAQRLAFARVLRQSGQLRPSVRKQAVERLLQRTRRLPERRRLTFVAGVVMLKPPSYRGVCAVAIFERAFACLGRPDIDCLIPAG